MQYRTMGEEYFEEVAQLQHENAKLVDELNHLKEHMLGLEESLNLKCTELSMEKRQFKSLEQQINFMCQSLKEKDQLIDSLQDENKNCKQTIAQLVSDNLLLKESYCNEKKKDKEIETLKTREENLIVAYNKLKEENQSLKSELTLKSEEYLSNAFTVKNLLHQMKELENEKAELMAMRDALRLEKEEQQKNSENIECFCRKDPDFPKFPLQIFTQDKLTSAGNKDSGKSNLREELLEVELKEKDVLIKQLEDSIRQKEEDDLERNKAIEELLIALTGAGLLNYNLKIDARMDSLAFYGIYRKLLKRIKWPEGQSTECKPLTDVPGFSVVVKDGVQTTQPSCARVIETISIASQTDPLKNLSPVLPFRAFEKLESDFNLCQNQPDLDPEVEEPLSFIKNDGAQKLFSERKNCDLDMDIYRSCRKLSVLPEEDIDESLIRKSSLKKPYGSNLNYFNLKIHSADDVRKIQTFKPLLKATSCSSFSPKNNNPGPFESHWEKPDSCRIISNTVTSQEYQSDEKENELELSIMSPRDVLRQPHSFDSYLDPLKVKCSPLLRQASDPTQSTVFAPPITRRGSYLRRPKSTCRPLTLPCDKGVKKKEERICKVRFDLAGIPPKKDDNIEKETDSSPVLNGTKKIKMISRFRVEIIDEIEFRKSLEENGKNTSVTRKRPPLIHSVVYKKSVLSDLANFTEKDGASTSEPNNISTESPDSPLYDTATEDSPADSFDIDSSESSYPWKRRRQSDVSCYSFEDSQDSSEGNDILIKSIKLHTNSKCILMKDLKKENSDSSCSNADSEIPYIDAEDLPVIKPSPDVVKISPVTEAIFSEKQLPSVAVVSPGSTSEGSDAYLTPGDLTPLSENNETSTFGLPKSTGLSKSPTVLKNLANFELLATISESRKLVQNVIIEENAEEESEDKLFGDAEERETCVELSTLKTKNDGLKRTSSDVSEASESETLTYGTVKSHIAGSSDCDSDTYVTVWSDKSFAFERKFSDLSENSSSPYNTPPDTSSASFCTPPDTYSPILNSVKRYPAVNSERAHRSADNNLEQKMEEFSANSCSASELCSSSPYFSHPCKFMSEKNSLLNRNEEETVPRTQYIAKDNYSVIFDSPKLEFYETNNSAVDLEVLLRSEEGLTEDGPKTELKYEKEDLESLSDPSFIELEDFTESMSKRNSLDSPKLLERRGKKHPPLSRQNSTEDYYFLDPHDSCLNLSEEISSPSTTPDTSNKTVIFKNVPLTVSNTIDLDDDFPISEAEIQVNFNGSQAEMLDISQRREPIFRYLKDGHCLSEPCTPSISSADFQAFSIPRKQRSSFTEESLTCRKFEANLPEIIVSRLSSESDNSDSEIPVGIPVETDFASNISDRSEVHLSDVNSISGQSDNCGSLSEHSDNVISDVFTSDSDKSSAVSPEITQNSSPSSASDNTSPTDNLLPDAPPEKSSTASTEDFQPPGDVRECISEENLLKSGEISTCAKDMP